MDEGQDLRRILIDTNHAGAATPGAILQRVQFRG
jgi:hypothetical protein